MGTQHWPWDRRRDGRVLTNPSGRVFRPDQRPDVEVLRDGVWYPGELRAWQQREDGWWANVQWHTGPGITYLATVPSSDVRPAPDPLSVDTPTVNGDTTNNTGGTP